MLGSIPDVGWNPNQQIFHDWRISHDEHGEHKRKRRKNTRGNTQINTNMITQVLDPRYTSRYMIHSQQWWYKDSLLPEEVLDIPWDLPRCGGLESEVDLLRRGTAVTLEEMNH